MVGSYYYLTYKNGRLVKRRTYRRNLHRNYSNEEYRYFRKKRLVRPIYKRGLHRYSKPWKHYRQYSIPSGQFKPRLPCGYSSNQLWTGICRAWNAFTIWKQKNDREMMQYYGLIIHKLQKKLDLPLTKFDIYIGDEYEDEEDESENKGECDSYEGRGQYGDDYGNDKGSDEEGLYDTSNDVPSRLPISDEELLEIAERPIYYSGQ
ncbi:MAG TPA: hypothetical protein VE544_05900 [Nitrososphaeraceae archaeon]|nr:hypothetical protein [Nitrososphaeraceae archaeon]